MQVIIPTTDKDYLRVKRNLDQMVCFLKADEIIFVGSERLEALVASDRDKTEQPEKIRFLNENELINFNSFTRAMAGCLAEEGYILDEKSKPGWYYQQFLKMAFHRICKGDYYMSWDADTIPVREINMFDTEGHPCFDIKAEYQASYFITIKKLFGIDKQISESFISEHMIFSKNRMGELVEEIEAAPYKGESFCEKLLYAMGIDNMLRGFSEFETYGTWMMARHPGEYVLREWHSMRIGGAFMKPGEMTEADRRWLARDYDAISFESYNSFCQELADFFSDPRYREKISAAQFYQIVLESGIFGNLENGGLSNGDAVFPV